MKKVLLFVDNLEVGGIQTFLLNLITALKNKYFFDILTLDDGKTYNFEEKFRNAGVSVFKLNNVWLNNPFDYILYLKQIKTFFLEHSDYDVVHLNSSSKNFLVLKYAKKNGIKTRIIHSHNTGFQTKNILKKIVGNILKSKIKKYATDYFACSDLAGEWLFGKKMAKSGSVILVKNGIDLKKFKYDVFQRENIRRNLKIEDSFVICNIGRFVMQKNHIFILQVFKKILEIEPKSCLLLIGEGELLSEIKEKAKELNIANRIFFLGYIANVSPFLQASDLFFMPSIYEGFPVTCIEAQASGLPCLFSDTVTLQAKLLDETSYLSLSNDYLTWAKKCLEYKEYNRNKKANCLKQMGYDIYDSANIISKIYDK